VNPVAQTQLPLDCAAPWLLHVVASEYWHAAPRNPALQAQLPLAWATPLPLHVVTSEYWHAEPA
jgi:hypothetical protein